MSDTARVLRPNRAQLELRPTDLESLLPEDHRARAVWEFVCGLDLSPWYESIRSVEGEAGRPAIDPAILLSLWIYATLEGVGSARAVARLCEQARRVPLDLRRRIGELPDTGVVSGVA